MAEGLLRFRYGGTYEAFSAGTHPSSVHPLAVQVLSEWDIDISTHLSESVSVYLDQPFDAVVTTCNSAQETCPFFPGAKRLIHHSFVDPSSESGSDEAILSAFRKTRDEIDRWIQHTFNPREFGVKAF